MTTDVQGWGWEWIKKTHLDQLEFKTGIEEESALFTLMTQTANEPDKKQTTGEYGDKLKKVASGWVLLRTLNGNLQTFFPVAEDPGASAHHLWKYRGVSRFFGDGGKAHGAVGHFSSHPLHHRAPLIYAFMPYYPRIAPKLKFLTNYSASMELIPTSGKNLGSVGKDSATEIAPLGEDENDWYVKLEGRVEKAWQSFILIDCGVPVFIGSPGFLGLKEGDGVRAEGALYAYPEP